MDNMTLAHVGGELVLIGGVAFYFHRKTTLLTEQIEVLKQENKKLAEAIIELQENLNQLGMVIMNAPIQQRSPLQTPPQHKLKMQAPLQPRQESMSSQLKMHHQQGSRKLVEKADSDTGDETLDDRILDQELEEIEKPQRKKCDKDICELVD